GYNVGWTVAGEWLAYTVNVSGGAFLLQVRVASAGAGGRFHIELDGVDVSGALTIPDTGGTQSWYTLSRSVTLAGGAPTRKVRLVMDANGPSGFVGNFNYFTFSSYRPPLATPTPTPTSTPTVAPGTPTATGSPGRLVFPNGYTWIPGTFENE